MSDFVKSLNIQPGDIDRIIVHWTAGGPYPTEDEKKFYHVLIDTNGEPHLGKFNPDDNISTSDGSYAAHTLHANTKAVGMSICGMREAVEDPLKLGPNPFNEAQFMTSVKIAAEVLFAAGLPCEPHTALSHAEVEKTLGIKQRGKWDISVLPWRGDIRGARAVGDYWRSLIQTEMAKMGPVVSYVTDPATTLRSGNTSPDSRVKLLQVRLRDLGYFSGKVDGLFGDRTRGAVLAFQADHSLSVDGVVGSETWDALNTAKAKEPRKISEADLRADGSRTIKGADDLRASAIGVATVGSAVSLLTQADSIGSAVATSRTPLETVFNMAAHYWPVLVFVVFALVLWNIAHRITQARVSDAKKGANVAR